MVLGINSFGIKVWALALSFFSVPLVFGDESGDLAVCLLEDNTPYSNRKMSLGFDYDLAGVLAENLGLKFTPVWISNSTQIQEVENDYPFRRLARGECNLILSVPGPVEYTIEEGIPITLGNPYYAAAFELVGRTNTSPRIKAVKGKQVAIQSQTVAHFALRMLGGKSKTYFSMSEAIAGIIENETEIGLLWGPTSGWKLHELVKAEDSLGFVEGYEPPRALRWNIHFATREGDGFFRDLVSGAIKSLDQTGELSKLMHKYHFPDRRSYASTYTLGAINDLQY
jgi:ABC-type amino acid transport substrate-binding protein